MKKRKQTIITLLAGMLLMAAWLSGCGKRDIHYTPDDHADDTADSQSDDIADTEGEGGLAARLGIPEACDLDVDVGASGLDSIRIVDDEIEIPTRDGMSVAYYEAVRLDNSYKQKIGEAIFDEGQEVYNTDHPTKEQLEALIEFEKEEHEYLVAQGREDIDPDYELRLQEMEEELSEAPEEYPPAGDYSGERFQGNIFGEEYILLFSQADAGGAGISAAIFGPFADSEHSYYEGPPIDELEGNNLCKMTPEEAVVYAEDIMGRCGITELVQSDILALEWRSYDYSTVPEGIVNIQYDGYIVTYTRAVNGTPVYQGSLNSVENIAAGDANPAEEFRVYVNDNGLIQAYWHIGFLETGEEERNVELLSWEEMVAAANAHIGEYYAQYPTLYNSITFNDVCLTYYPVADEEKKNCYKYIPVWIFAQYETPESASPYQLVVMNAMDGTVIDLSE